MQEDTTFADLIDSKPSQAATDRATKERIAAEAAAPQQTPAGTGTAVAKVDIKAVALSRFGQWRAGAAVLVAKYHKVLFADLDTTKGYNAARAALAEVRAPRFAAQNVSKASKSELAAVSRAVGTEEAAVIAYLADTETAILEQIEAEDARRETARIEAARIEAKRAAEAARVDAERKAKHEAGLAVIRSYLAKGAGLPSERLSKGVAILEGMVIGDSWEEFRAQAENARQEAIAGLTQLMVDTKAREDREAAAEQLRLDNERIAADLAEQRRKLDEEMAEFLKQKAQAAPAAASPAPLEVLSDNSQADEPAAAAPLTQVGPPAAAPAPAPATAPAPAPAPAAPAAPAPAPRAAAPRTAPRRELPQLSPALLKAREATELACRFGHDVEGGWLFSTDELASLIAHVTLNSKAA